MKTTRRLGMFLILTQTALVALVGSAPAQPAPGKIQVQGVRGSAWYSSPGRPPAAVSAGDSFPEGTVVRTAAGSAVDLLIAGGKGRLRLIEGSSLTLRKIPVGDSDAATRQNMQFELSDGSVVGDLGALSGGARWEIIISNGILGVARGRFRANAQGFLVQLNGEAVFAHVLINGEPAAHALRAPPPVYFSPLEGVKKAPGALVQEVRSQLTSSLGRK